MTLEELALKIAKEQGSDALDDRIGLGETLDEYDLGDYEREELVELVRAIHGRAWELYEHIEGSPQAAGTEED